MNVGERFGANLVRVRKQAGISQEELGFRASLHRNEIGQLEQGKRLPRIDTLVKLAGSLGVEPAALLDGLSWETGETVVGRFVEAHVPGLGTIQRRVRVDEQMRVRGGGLEEG